MPAVDNLHAEMEHLERRYGKSGMQAIATLMHDMGSDTTIQFGDGTWWPCDFIMQCAWEHGGTPEFQPVEHSAPGGTVGEPSYDGAPNAIPGVRMKPKLVE